MRALPSFVVALDRLAIGDPTPIGAPDQKDGEKMIRKLVLVAVSAGPMLGVAACNTVRGVGQDLESAANSVDRAM
ncbi:hypothetical protein WBP06_08085 [Novosphingobium sp. BL-8H]|uniref:hypothetical protein n=1 Tax=Novosphingobium sp. BL-8H TaxID=3127640 RepID=UPI0037583763